MSKIICPECQSYEHCKELWYADAEECVNFQKKVEYVEAQLQEESPIYWKDYNGYVVGKSTIAEDLLVPQTIQITGCERIILKDKSLNFVFELSRGQIEDFDEIIINGIKFKKEI